MGHTIRLAVCLLAICGTAVGAESFIVDGGTSGVRIHLLRQAPVGPSHRPPFLITHACYSKAWTVQRR